MSPKESSDGTMIFTWPDAPSVATSTGTSSTIIDTTRSGVRFEGTPDNDDGGRSVERSCNIIEYIDGKLFVPEPDLPRHFDYPIRIAEDFVDLKVDMEIDRPRIRHPRVVILENARGMGTMPMHRHWLALLGVACGIAVVSTPMSTPDDEWPLRRIGQKSRRSGPSPLPRKAPSPEPLVPYSTWQSRTQEEKRQDRKQKRKERGQRRKKKGR